MISFAKYCEERSNAQRFNDCLAIMGRNYGDESCKRQKVWSMWTMENNCSGKVSWTKKFSFGGAPRIRYVRL